MGFSEMLSAAMAVITAFFSGIFYGIVGQPATAQLPADLKRDGTPKKYFTLSFDDGITQDEKIMEICRKYGFDSVTFNINSNLCGENWAWVADMVNCPGLVHQRFTEEQLKNGIYNGFDVAAHAANHASIKAFDTDPFGLYRELEKDADRIYRLTGTKPLGMAWPGGDTEYTEKSVENVYRYTSLRYARGTTATHTFDLPRYFLRWLPTCSVVEPDLLQQAQAFLDAPCESDMLFYVWGHGYELDAFNLYDTLEQLIKMMSGRDDVVCVSNTEFYLLFRDEIPACTLDEAKKK